VHSDSEPFYADSGAGSAGGAASWHIVTVTDYDPDTGKVQIDNQWADKVDHKNRDTAIDVHELHVATRDPENRGSIHDLKDERIFPSSTGNRWNKKSILKSRRLAMMAEKRLHKPDPALEEAAGKKQIEGAGCSPISSMSLTIFWLIKYGQPPLSSDPLIYKMCGSGSPDNAKSMNRDLEFRLSHSPCG